VALYRTGQTKPYLTITATNGVITLPDGLNEVGQDPSGVQIVNPAFLVEPTSISIPEPGLTERGAPKLLYDYE
jgi:hypothetical protein